MTVGVSGALPKLTTIRLLEPPFALGDDLRVTLRIDKTDRLLADLSLHAIDLVLADAPVPAGMPVRPFNHRHPAVVAISDAARGHLFG